MELYPFAAGRVVQYKQRYQRKEVLVATRELGRLREFYQQISAEQQASTLLKSPTADHPQ